MNDSIRTERDLRGDAYRDADPMTEAGRAPPSYRLPAATHLGHVSLQVADLPRSLAYYGRVLGLRVLERTEAAALLGTQTGGTPLVHLTERIGAPQSQHHARFGLYHFAILLPDRPALGRFISHLDAIGVKAGAADHLVSEALYLQDPDGLGIEVYADRPKSSWTTIDRQIRMVNLALDFREIVHAGGGQPWTGTPAGTVMGHVHLQVGDLAQAAAFYHRALGFDEMVWDYQGALFLGAGGYHHHLGLNTWVRAGAAPPTDAEAKLLEWCLVLPSVSDVQQAAASLASAGYAVTADGDDRLTVDPWGTRLRLLF